MTRPLILYQRICTLITIISHQLDFGTRHISVFRQSVHAVGMTTPHQLLIAHGVQLVFVYDSDKTGTKIILHVRSELAQVQCHLSALNVHGLNIAVAVRIRTDFQSVFDRSNHILRLYLFPGGILHSFWDVKSNRLSVFADVPVCTHIIFYRVRFRIPLEQRTGVQSLRPCRAVKLEDIQSIPFAVNNGQLRLFRLIASSAAGSHAEHKHGNQTQYQ